MSKNIDIKSTYVETSVTSASFMKDARIPGKYGRHTQVSSGMIDELKETAKGILATHEGDSVLYPWCNVADVVYAKR